jgi:hypothetical protein
MTTTPVVPGARRQRLTVSVDYSAGDVERAADALGLSLSDEEVDSILVDVGGELPRLAAAALDDALAARIHDALTRVARGHAWSDDD